MPKRTISALGDERTASHPRRRQPQTSCDFCRSKKLRCDRAVPCGNCVTRQRPCLTQGEAIVAREPSTGDGEVSERLRLLEEAVFGAKDDVASSKSLEEPWFTSVDRSRERMPTKIQHPLHIARFHQPAPQDLDYGSTGESLASELCDKIIVRVSGGASGSTPRSEATDNTPASSREPAQCVLLPSRREMQALFCDYTEYPSYMMPILYEQLARTLIADVYTRLSHGQQVAMSKVAFLMSIAASAAFLWDSHTAVRHKFDSEDAAAQQSHIWRKAAWDLLDQSQRAGPCSLYEVQARMILADLIYNLEGCSARYRHLHSTAVSAAREISLHLIDAPGHSRRETPGEMDDAPTREIKRRTWWYLVGTDWLLGSMGGPLDRTYTVHPGHMMVSYPRDITDDALANCEDPAEPQSSSEIEGRSFEMTCFLQRIRVAEISRATIDALPLGGGDADSLPSETFLELDRQYEAALAALSVEAQGGLPHKYATRRQILRLGIHARRANLFRRFLPFANSASRGDDDPRRARFGIACRRSARAVLETSLVLVQDSLGLPHAAGAAVSQIQAVPPSHRNGCLVNHLFMACALLASDPALCAEGDKEGGSSAEDGFDREELRDLLKRSCQVLEQVGEVSALAGSLVRRLVGVFRRSGVRGVETGYRRRPEPVEYAASPDARVDRYQEHGAQKQPSMQHQPQSTQQQAVRSGSEAFVMAEMDPAAPGGNAQADPLEHIGIWEDLVNINSIPTYDEWNRLFSEMETFGGPIEL